MGEHGLGCACSSRRQCQWLQRALQQDGRSHVGLARELCEQGDWRSPCGKPYAAACDNQS